MLNVYTDGASAGNPGPSGLGLLITGENIHQQINLPLPDMDNHEAEWVAICYALHYLIKNNDTNQTIILHSDSKTAMQIIQQNQTKNPKFKPYLNFIQAHTDFFPLILFQWIPEKQNKGADSLAKQGLQQAKNCPNPQQLTQSIAFLHEA